MMMGGFIRTAIVTAASRGIGKACAEALARDGHDLVICSRHAEEIEKTAQGISKETGRSVIGCSADVGKEEDLKKLVDTTLKQFQRIDVLVNNCGGPPPGGIHELSDDQWLQSFGSVILSVVRLTRRVIPIMQKQKGGRIITITSATAREPFPPLLISSTLRPGLSGFARYLGRELAPHNILINNVLPGSVATARQAELAKYPYQKKETPSVPMGRMARPEEIANVVSFLASSSASYITGCDIPVEGGILHGI